MKNLYSVHTTTLRSIRKALLSITLLICIGFSQQSFAGSGIFDGYAVFNGTYYDLLTATGNPDFQGASLGSFTTGTNITIGGQIKTYKNAADNICGGKIWYSIYPAAGSPGAFTAVTLNFDTDLGGGDQQWTTAPGSSIAVPTAPGAYKIAVYVTDIGDDAGGCSNDPFHTANNAGANWVANFNVTATVYVTATGGLASANYTTLKAAFDAINAGSQTGTINIRIWGNTTETATAALNGSGAGSASYTSISIQPDGGAARTITGNLALPLVDFNGCDNVTVDGLNSGGNSLTISNTSTSSTSGTSTIRFQTDATSNTITRCSILGSSTMAMGTSGGNIWFGSAAVTTGNDNNTISFCDIGPAGANLPSKCITFTGTSNTDPGTANSGIIINNNNIFDYFNATVASAGIDLNSGSVATTISNNKFYQTATRTQTSGAAHRAISINNSSGNGYQITGNTIGFANSAGTGTYSFVGFSSSSIFTGILLSVGTTTASSVQGNTIAGIAMSGAVSGTSSTAIFKGIYVSAGLTTIGDITGNTIGSMSTTGSITFTSSSSSASDVIGIFNFGSSAWTTNNNNIGGITVSNSSTGASNFYGLRCFTSSGVTWTCNNNTIGGTVANSINVTSTATGTIVNGILNSSPAATMTGNTIRNMTVAGGTGTTSSASMVGICFTASSANHTVSQNTIYNLSNSNTTAATVVTGIQYTATTGTNTVARNNIYALTSATNSTSAEINGIRVAGGTTTYKNNMIALGAGVTNAIGSAASNSGVAGINGINEALGTDNFWHNNIYIGGSPTTGSGASYAFNGTQTINTRSFRDNIFVNARSNSGATGKNYAVKINGTTVNPTGLTINNNIYYASGSGGVFGFFNSLDVANLTAWKTAVGQDAASFESNPQYLDPANATPDLHIHPSNPTQAEGNGFDLGVTDDYDGQTRSGFTPVDIGADAGNFVSAGDITAPSITYTALTFTCATGDRNLTGVTISDGSGVPTTGPLVPRIYYKKNAGAWFSQAGSLTAGTGISGTWSFTIVAADMGGLTGGDIVSYYVIAQDVAGTPNISSNPTGVVATDVNTITTPPTPNTYSISSTLAGTYNVGIGQTYTTLTAAATAYNNSCLGGAITFQLMDATYPSETFPITFNANTDASATNTLTIKPASAVTSTISGSSASSIIKLNGADYITIDGSNTGGTDRSLTITNTNTTGPNAVVWISSTGLAAGARNNVIKNTILTGGSPTLTSASSPIYGVLLNGSTIAATTGDDNDNNTLQNNEIYNVGVGIYGVGSSTNLMDNLDIIGNRIGNNTVSSSLGYAGVRVEYSTNSDITSNTIFNISHSAQYDSDGQFGVYVKNTTTNCNVSKNNIYNVSYTGTSGYGGKGVYLNALGTSSNTTVSNNMISGMNGDSWSSFTLGDHTAGINLNGTQSGINIYYNSVNLTGNYSRSGTSFTAGIYVNSLSTVLDIRNNIFFNSLVNTGAGAATSKSYAIASDATSTSFTFINNNSYGVGGTQGVFGYGVAVDKLNLAAWQGFTTQDALSKNVTPDFASATDLHLSATANNFNLESAGVSIAGIATDIDGDTRSGTPDIGVDEFIGCLNITVYADVDGDTYGDPANTTIDCDGGTPPFGYVLNNTDCNDLMSSIYPGATETCNGLDDDCDGTPDDGLTFTTYYWDGDGDTYGNPAIFVNTCSAPGGSYVLNNTDCNDAMASINPGAAEICVNGFDDNCNGLVDDGCVLYTFYLDFDGDTYGDAASTTTNYTGIAPAGYVADNTDCDDSNAAINPGATEICNGIDDDCAGGIDNGLTFLNYYTDADADGYGDAFASPVSSCSAVAGSVTNNTDCNDSNNLVNPAGTEICNGVDDDCDGTVDDGITYAFSYFDGDGDGYGDPSVVISTCDGPPTGYVVNNTDCNDGNAAINPAASEVCNAIDDDCDGTADDGLIFTNYYTDADGDGYGDSGASPVSSCSAVGGSVTNNTDCNDGSTAINPGATEICNGIDDDCAGGIDDGLIFTNYYTDADGDGYGDSGASPVSSCSAVGGSVTNNTDCNDGSAAINPGATEICNGIDDDCAGGIDNGLTFLNYYTDADGDGYGDSGASPVSSCSAVGGSVTNNTDCNDGNAAINPAATEICNAIDDDCNGTADDGLIFTTYYFDGDGDTYGNATIFTSTCDGAPAGYVADNSDCADYNAAVNPAATEICNGIDDDCDASVDEGLVFTTYYADTDADTYGDAFNTTSTCDGMPAGYVTDATDCDDANNTVYPGATEICDGLDNNCNGDYDEGTVSATISPVGSVTTCRGVNTTLTANGGVGYTYQWFKNGNVLIGATSSTYATSKPGNYQVQVTIPEGCFAVSSVTAVNTNPNPNANISAPNGTSLCTTVKLKASYDASYTWQWNKGGLPVAGATSYQYFPTTPGSYTCTITNSFGCSRTTAAINVTACKDGEIATSENSFEIYPNPTDNAFTVELWFGSIETSDATIQIFNMMGEMIYNGNSSIVNNQLLERIELDQTVPGGVYFVKVLVGNSEFTKQLILQK